MNTRRHAQVTLRTPALHDAAEISRLITELGYSATPKEIAKRLKSLMPQATHFVIVAEQTAPVLVGWVHAEHRVILESGARVELIGLVVDPTLRRCGISRSLVEATEAWATARDVPTIR